MAAPTKEQAEPVGVSISSSTSETRYTSPICILNQMLVGLLTRKLVNLLTRQLVYKKNVRVKFSNALYYIATNVFSLLFKLFKQFAGRIRKQGYCPSQYYSVFNHQSTRTRKQGETMFATSQIGYPTFGCCYKE